MTRTKTMGRDITHNSAVFTHTPVPAHLCEQVCQAVLRERQRQARLRFIISSLCGTSSLVGLVFALPALLHAAQNSGFVSYSSLLLTDTQVALSHTNLFLVPVLEALPGIETITTLFLLSVFLVSVQSLVRSMSCRPFAFITPLIINS